MNLLKALEQASTVTNTKGGEYYSTTYNANLDLFSGVSRYNSADEIILNFHNAYKEDRDLALANLLYILDIREGKGERRIFKIIFKDLCKLNSADAKLILSYISSLGRYDYILEGLHTPIEDDVIALIKEQLNADLNSEHPSLLAKWLPSHRTHSKQSGVARYLMHKLGMKECEYRKILSLLRGKINIVERNLSNKDYDKINFEEVPTKAMLKYQNAFYNHMLDKYEEYRKGLLDNTAKVNTNGLFCYEIVKRVWKHNCDRVLLNAMWESQKNISSGDKNILVVADTSGSMTLPDYIPLASSIGLAIYTAERNKGIFHNRFITFSNNPTLQTIKGTDIVDKIENIKSIVANTNIDKVFKLLLNVAVNNGISNEEMPSHIVIISDMEFDRGVYSENGTNFQGWKNEFSKAGYTLPKIIFWNVAAETYGLPVTKNDNDCIMVSGFSTNILSHIFDLENYSPMQAMLEVLEKYLNMLH